MLTHFHIIRLAQAYILVDFTFFWKIFMRDREREGKRGEHCSALVEVGAGDWIQNLKTSGLEVFCRTTSYLAAIGFAFYAIAGAKSLCLIKVMCFVQLSVYDILLKVWNSVLIILGLIWDSPFSINYFPATILTCNSH